MKDFMDKDFVLETETAKRLFHEYAEALPVVDYHCHIPPREIYENRKFNNLAEVWLGGQNPDGTCFGDHYKWRLMRANGVPEEYVTGGRDGLARITKLAETLELAIGNPMYHWCNLELRKFFGYEGHLSADTAEEVFKLCNDKLQNDPGFTVRGFIEQANVTFIGTTDDPVDTLEWHEKIAADPSITVQVCPSYRPDKAINITKPGFAEYIAKLAESVGKKQLSTAEEVRDALLERLEFFKRMDCRAADHGLDYVMYRPCTTEEANAAFAKAMAGKELTLAEAEGYQTMLLVSLGRAYHRMGIVMQLHYSCLRNVNEKAFKELGPDTGYDMIGNAACGAGIAGFLNALTRSGGCPKTIIYSLNPTDFDQISSLTGCFQNDEAIGKIQHGSAWWFNDTKSGMEAQMRSLANMGLLGNFVGMLTDSRSFLSYPRHDYFRRIVCNMVGHWVENGEYPNDEKALRRIVEGICYRNAARYFGL